MKQQTKAALIDVTKIWDAGDHNAFSGLTRFNNRWYCTFREGSYHVSLDGNARVISSEDGRHWESAALLTSPNELHPDVRDPKIWVTPDNRLMVVAAGTYRGEVSLHQSYVWFSEDGKSWDAGTPIGEKDFWIWNCFIEGETIYGVAHAEENGAAEGEGVRLYSSTDGVNYEPIVTIRQDEHFPNETALLFENGNAIALMRREWDIERGLPYPEGAGTDLLGTSSAPYTDWTWHDIGFHIGGPALIRLPDGRIIAGGRKTKPQAHTSLWSVDIESNTLEELITLPSANDSSYPAFVWHDGMLWVSYFSSHEGKSSIYLARLNII